MQGPNKIAERKEAKVMPYAGNINESDSDFSESSIGNSTHRFRD